MGPLVAAMEQHNGNAGLLAQSLLAFAADIGAGFNESDRAAMGTRSIGAWFSPVLNLDGLRPLLKGSGATAPDHMWK